MNPIFAKKVVIIAKNGIKHNYTHVLGLEIINKQLVVTGETDSNGSRAATTDGYDTKHLHVMFVEFYEPTV